MKHIFQCSEGVNRCNKFLLLISGMVRQFSLTDFHLEDVFHVYRLTFMTLYSVHLSSVWSVWSIFSSSRSEFFRPPSASASSLSLSLKSGSFHPSSFHFRNFSSCNLHSLISEHVFAASHHIDSSSSRCHCRSTEPFRIGDQSDPTCPCPCCLHCLSLCCPLCCPCIPCCPHCPCCPWAPCIHWCLSLAAPLSAWPTTSSAFSLQSCKLRVT